MFKPLLLLESSMFFTCTYGAIVIINPFSKWSIILSGYFQTFKELNDQIKDQLSHNLIDKLIKKINEFSYINQMNSQCYIHGYPLACQNQLQDLFNLIREGEEFITLERIFKLLRAWQYDVPFSNLCKLLRMANQVCHQNVKNHLNELAFHQLLHNPDLQMTYKPKKDETANTPPTLEGLFRRIGEQIERKRLQEKLNEDNITNREKFNFMLQLLQVGSPRNDRKSSIVVEKVKSVKRFKEDEFKLLMRPKKTKKKG
ncbi:unnamed protein product (macronuclear) [Paramecium tetraurelia]|uniref:Uncharacterized protein n=1 Tax=Paramecium tetraurelia TaxID=5888 RepID=A0CZB7_PARTE|nr:uncharacterized protein GSPATT00011707001 [Paramecium tetraurelia]CAK76134.1 unnamed protein product [Paramecium tetraurelia]|eukprot:XP_001443531.1 hypothetical protein (macronuclear) [Paramecium tetraurelia strain d4-2]